MDPMQLEKLMALLQAHQAQQGGMGMGGGMGAGGPPMGGGTPPMQQMGVPPGRFGPGQPTGQGMPVDQIPGMIPQPQAQPDTQMDQLRRMFMSGGAGDMRNIAMALGPAGQAAGGMGGAMRAGQQMGMPAKAQGMPPVEQMFDMAKRAPSMGGPGAAQAGRSLPAVLGMTGGVGYGGYKAVDAIMEMQKERERQMQELMKNMR